MAAGELSDHELWRTKGTPASTQKIKEIRPGGDADPGWITTLGPRVVFVADDGVKGAELWRSDGTEIGTTRVADLRAGAAGSVPYFLVAANGAIWFSADDGSHGRELWRYVP
jgi:ELWxxDGT repeat protein